MRQDPTLKDIVACPFMSEELLRRFAADLHGARDWVDGPSTALSSCL